MGALPAFDAAVSLLSYIHTHNAPEHTQSMAPTLATLDLLTPWAAHAHWGHRLDLAAFVPVERLKQLDAQAWAWTVWEAFELIPALDVIRLMEADIPEGNKKSWSGSLLVESTPSIELPELTHVLRRLGWHQPVLASDVLADAPIRRQDREHWARRWGGTAWWARCQALRLEVGLPDGDAMVWPVRPRL